MDRSLSPELISLALGDVHRLPSPNDLAALLATAEISLISGRKEVDPKLVEVGWYLHSVGSALESLQLYGLARRQAAFQVAGHIFDLALADADLALEERLRMTFAAQVASLRGSLNPNAIAAYRWRLGTQDPSPSLLEGSVVFNLGTALLGYDTDWLLPALGHLRTERRSLDEQWAVDLARTQYGVVVAVVEGVSWLAQFLQRGSRTALARAREILREAIEPDVVHGDLEHRWVAFHLWQLCDDLERGSPWSILPPDAQPSVPQAFTLSRPPILTLWPPQVDLLRGDRAPNAFDPATRRMVLSVPTSAGKTLVAQVLVADHLTRSTTAACFVAPTRSLCREIESSLRRRLRFLAAAAEVAQSDLLFDAPDTPAVRVEVMTPERLAYLLRLDSAAVLNRFGMFVIDEVHSLGDDTRGWTLEWVLATLHRLTLRTDHRLIAMSAAIGNRATIANWLDPEGAGIHFSSEWRGPRRVHVIYTSEADWNSVNDVPRTRANSPYLRECDVYGMLRIRPVATGQVHQLRITEPTGRLVTDAATNAKHGSSTPFYKTLAPLVAILGEAGPVLVISPTKPMASGLAWAIAESVEADPAEPWLIELAAARLGDEHLLVRCLRKGVAFHHASVPVEVLNGIEDEVAAERLRYIVATTTLTEGINLPVRTVVIAAQGTHGDGGFREFIIGPRLLNAIGRAGRSAKESEGWIILARNAAFDIGDFDRLRPTGDDLIVNSALATDEALAELEVFERQIRAGADLLSIRAGSHVDDFLSYIWYLCGLADVADLPEDEVVDSVGSFLEHTLAWQQIDAGAKLRWSGAAQQVQVRYRTEPEARRRRWARTGTSLATSAVFDELATELAELVAARPTEAIRPQAALRMALGERRLERLYAVPEARITRPRNQRGGRGTALLDIDDFVILTDWVSGHSLHQLADSHLGAVRDPDFRMEQMADYVTSAFDNYLPWALGILLEWTNARLPDDAEPIAATRWLPAYVRYGVDSPNAVTLLRVGVRSRALAAAVATDYESRPEEEVLSLREWLCRLGTLEWRTRYNPSAAELGSLLEFARTPGSRLASQVLAGHEVVVAVDMAEGEEARGECYLEPLPGDPEPPRIGVWMGDRQVGFVAPEHHSEVESLRATGVPLIATLREADGTSYLHITLRPAEEI